MNIAPHDLVHLPGSGEAEDPVGENPFPQTDARHRVWAEATRRAEEELARFKSELLKRRSSSSQELADFIIHNRVGIFHIWAKRAIHVVWGDDNISFFDQWIRNYAEATLQMTDTHRPSIVDRTSLLLELRHRLMQAVEYWKAEARRYVAMQSQEPSPGDRPEAKADGTLPAQPGETRRSAMAEPTEELIDLYVSDQWRIHGGPRSRVAREELRDRFIPVVIKAFGSVEPCLDLLLKESPCSNGRQIRNLIRACELFSLRMNREAIEENDQARALSFAKFAQQFHELSEAEGELFGTAASKNEQIRASLRTGVCRLQPYGTANPPTTLAGAELVKAAESPKKRGRRPSEERRGAIHEEIAKYSGGWRDHLDEIFEELDRRMIPLGDFYGKSINLDGTRTRVTKWGDLALAQGAERSQIVDVLRKYVPPRN